MVETRQQQFEVEVREELKGIKEALQASQNEVLELQKAQLEAKNHTSGVDNSLEEIKVLLHKILGQDKGKQVEEASSVSTVTEPPIIQQPKMTPLFSPPTQNSPPVKNPPPNPFLSSSSYTQNPECC